MADERGKQTPNVLPQGLSPFVIVADTADRQG